MRWKKRLTWIKDKNHTTLQRIHRIILALLCLKEVEYFGEDQSGSIVERQQRLVNHLLSPLEETWLGKSCPNDPLIPRIKALRMKIVPELTTGELTESERESRWSQLSKIYLAQQIASYPAEYLVSPTTDTRILETVERLEEDLTDKAGVHGPLEAIIEIDRAIEVPADRAPRAKRTPLCENFANVCSRCWTSFRRKPTRSNNGICNLTLNSSLMRCTPRKNRDNQVLF